MSDAAAASRALESIDALLPQTQCTRCGYPACRPYAAAIAAGSADIDRCPPGGTATIQALAELLGRTAKPLNARYGIEAPPRVAVIDEQRCIGCAKCLPACPVDAIVGAQRYMHSVVAEACNGCELCIPPCPVDCITMEPMRDSGGLPYTKVLDAAELQSRATVHRRRYQAHQARRTREETERQQLLAGKKQLAGERRQATEQR